MNPLPIRPTALILTLKSPVLGNWPAGADQTAAAAQRPLAVGLWGVRGHGKTLQDAYLKAWIGVIAPRRIDCATASGRASTPCLALEGWKFLFLPGDKIPVEAVASAMPWHPRATPALVCGLPEDSYP